MAGPDNTESKGSRSVGVALVAIVVGTSLVFSYAASDGKLLGQFFNSDREEPNSATAETTENAAALPASMREKEPGDDKGESENSQTLSDEEKQQLLRAKNFPWSLASDRYLENLAVQDTLDDFKQKDNPSLQSDPSSELTTGLSISSDGAAADINNFVLDSVDEYKDDDSEQLDLYENDADDAEPTPTTNNEETVEQETPSEPVQNTEGTMTSEQPPAEEPGNSTVDSGNDTSDQPAEDNEQTDTVNNDTETSGDSGSNSTDASENLSNSTSEE